jgi:2,3-bisphosphoglycerate-dependent phosphoglycerate mutase
MKNSSIIVKGLIYVIVVVVLIVAAGGAAVRYGLITTTAFIVRHAEKAAGDGDPPLSLEGRVRAKALAHVVEDARVAAAYCTQYQRTRETVKPLAQRLNIPIREINADQVAILVGDVLTNYAGKTVVIAGHSDTVPQIVHELGGSLVPPISGNEYDNLYVVIVHEVKIVRVIGLFLRKADTLHLKYGAPT